jgi:hypothetical protein
MILCYGNDKVNGLTWSDNSHTFMASQDGNSYVKLQGNGIIVSGIGTNPKLYLDNILLSSNNLPPIFYSGSKWSVMILNETTFTSGSWEFLGFMNTLSDHAYSGTKVGSIIYYNQILTSTDIIALTQWGLERFGNF